MTGSHNNPDARLHQCDSTSLPVEDGSLDAVLVADAWHWFDAKATTIELRRVLKPGAWLGLVWNVGAPVEPWQFDLAGESPDRIDRGKKRSFPLPYFPPDELELAWFVWEWELTPEHSVGNLATTSAVIAMTPEERQQHLTSAHSRFQQVCDATGRRTLPVRHEASCARWTPKRSGPGSRQQTQNRP